MKKAKEEPNFFFVDECGDPNFYKKGSKQIIVGEEGCSLCFGVGFLRTSNPEQIRQTLANLRQEVATSKYLKSVPSVSKSLVAFHAKNDCAEVRKMVYEALEPLDFGVQIVIARKREKHFRLTCKSKTHIFYDNLVRSLFRNQLHLATLNHITFARRGKKSRQHALKAAVHEAVNDFRAKYPKANVDTEIKIETSQPQQEPVLQVADYAIWAVQRCFEKSEMRYFEFLANKIEVINDCFDWDKKKTGGNAFYSRSHNPFHIDKCTDLRKSLEENNRPTPLAKSSKEDNGVKPTFTKANRPVD